MKIEIKQFQRTGLGTFESVVIATAEVPDGASGSDIRGPVWNLLNFDCWPVPPLVSPHLKDLEENGVKLRINQYATGFVSSDIYMEVDGIYHLAEPAGWAELSSEAECLTHFLKRKF